MVYYNPFITGKYNLQYNPSNQGFFHCSSVFSGVKQLPLRIYKGHFGAHFFNWDHGTPLAITDRPIKAPSLHEVDQVTIPKLIIALDVFTLRFEIFKQPEVWLDFCFFWLLLFFFGSNWAWWAGCMRDFCLRCWGWGGVWSSDCGMFLFLIVWAWFILRLKPGLCLWNPKPGCRRFLFFTRWASTLQWPWTYLWSLEMRGRKSKTSPGV